MQFFKKVKMVYFILKSYLNTTMCLEWNKQQCRRGCKKEAPRNNEIEATTLENGTPKKVMGYSTKNSTQKSNFGTWLLTTTKQ